MIEWHQMREVEKEDEAREKLHAVHQDGNDDPGAGDEEEEKFEEGDEVKAFKRHKFRKGKWSSEAVSAEIVAVNDDETYDVKYEDGVIARRIPSSKVEKEEEDVDQPDGIILIRAIQLMSEGHFEFNQDICREQPNNARSFNLLDDFVNYLGIVSKIPCNESTAASAAVADCILEVIQGPCVKNQQVSGVFIFCTLDWWSFHWLVWWFYYNFAHPFLPHHPPFPTKFPTFFPPFLHPFPTLFHAHSTSHSAPN